MQDGRIHTNGGKQGTYKYGWDCNSIIPMSKDRSKRLDAVYKLGIFMLTEESKVSMNIVRISKRSPAVGKSWTEIQTVGFSLM